MTVQVQLVMGASPDRFQLSVPLAQLLGITVESRMYIIASLWQYIKLNRLQVRVFARGGPDPSRVTEFPFLSGGFFSPVRPGPAPRRDWELSR